MKVAGTEMVIPDTYEKEKWESPDKKEEKPEFVNIQAKLEAIKHQQQEKELTIFDKIELKYGQMLSTLDDLQSKQNEFDKYKRHIVRQNETCKNNDRYLARDTSKTISKRISETSIGRVRASSNASPPGSPRRRREDVTKRDSLQSFGGQPCNNLERRQSNNNFAINLTTQLDQ